MKTSRFKPLDVAQLFDFDNVTPVTREIQPCVTDKHEENHEVNPTVTHVTHVTPVTRKKQYRLSETAAHPVGEDVTSGDSFRAIEYRDISHAEAGMVRCYCCGHSEALGRSEPSRKRVIRCRNPNLHGGRWVTLCGEKWHRCEGFIGRNQNHS